MRKFALILVLILSVLELAISAELEDGFYELSLQGSGLPVKIYDRVFHTGNSLNLTVLKAEVRSQNNANTKYNLSITVPYDENLSSNVALFVGGSAFPLYGLGSDQKTVRLSFPIDGQERADLVANVFDIKPILRRHPHHELEVSVKSTAEEYSVGQRVSAVFQIRNVGGTTVSFQKGGRNRADRDNQYVFVCRLYGKQVEDIGSSSHTGGLSFNKVLRPGESFEEEVDLSKWFAFDKPGVYELLGSYYMAFTDPEQDISLFPIWADYATADFSIKIR